MKLDKGRIAKIKSNIEVDLEFSQEVRQECKSFEPFDYDDNADAFFNTIEEKLKYAIECLDDCSKTSDLNKKTVYIDAIIISLGSVRYAINELQNIIYEKDDNSNNEEDSFKYKDLFMQLHILDLSIDDIHCFLNRNIEFVEQEQLIMKYTIRVEALIEFESFVDCFDYKKGEKFDGLKYEPVQDIAKRYSDGEDRFFEKFDSAINQIDKRILGFDDYLKLYTGRNLEEYFTVNFAGLDYAKLNRESVVLECDNNIYSIGTTDVCAEGIAIALIEADYLSDCDEEFVRNDAQKILVRLINKAIDFSRSYGAFTIKEPEFNITIVNK